MSLPVGLISIVKPWAARGFWQAPKGAQQLLNDVCLVSFSLNFGKRGDAYWIGKLMENGRFLERILCIYSLEPVVLKQQVWKLLKLAAWCQTVRRQTEIDKTGSNENQALGEIGSLGQLMLIAF